MARANILPVIVCLGLGFCFSQTKSNDGDFTLALPSHPGRLQWHAEGFKIIESSAKANGSEIGIRGKDASGRLTFLGFLFLVPAQAQLTSVKCRDSAMEEEKKANPSLRIIANTETTRSDGQQLASVRYISQGRGGETKFMMRGFVATGDLCGDLEFYSDASIAADDPELTKVFASYQLDPAYSPLFGDSFLYAQILYEHHAFKAAAPLFEQALTKLKDSGAPESKTMRRVATDQAGMAYGMSGNIPKARMIFETAIAKDPDYPLYYYNLACADAEEGKLGDARTHLEQAFARKNNTVPGEAMPDPAKDESFLPYRNQKDFWKFIEGLR
jgi:tetratricopeptide (TPR) repeat protein